MYLQLVISTSFIFKIQNQNYFLPAHCLKDRDYVEVYVGAHHEHNTHEKTRQFQRVNPSALFPHPSWEPGTGYDVGIIKLPKSFKLNEYVGLVKLPYGLEDNSFIGEHALVSGWGEIGKKFIF